MLQSAACGYRMKPPGSRKRSEAYSEAYGYLLKHHQEMNYRDYKAIGLPIGSSDGGGLQGGVYATVQAVWHEVEYRRRGGDPAPAVWLCSAESGMPPIGNT